MKATELIEQRRDSHGDPLITNAAVGQAWSQYIKRRYGLELDIGVADVCEMMIRLKLCRAAFGNPDNPDHQADMDGYREIVRRSKSVRAEIDLLSCFPPATDDASPAWCEKCGVMETDSALTSCDKCGSLYCGDCVVFDPDGMTLCKRCAVAQLKPLSPSGVAVECARCGISSDECLLSNCCKCGDIICKKCSVSFLNEYLLCKQCADKDKISDPTSPAVAAAGEASISEASGSSTAAPKLKAENSKCRKSKTGTVKVKVELPDSWKNLSTYRKFETIEKIQQAGASESACSKAMGCSAQAIGAFKSWWNKKGITVANFRENISPA